MQSLLERIRRLEDAYNGGWISAVEEKCLGIKVSGTKEERLLAMIEALGDRPLHAISIKKAHRISPVELRIRPPQSWMYGKRLDPTIVINKRTQTSFSSSARFP